MGDINRDLPSEAKAALERGNKIEAIKCVRVAHGVGLKEAKDVVEQFLERSPELRNRMVAANAENSNGILKWVFIIATAVVAYYFFAGSSR